MSDNADNNNAGDGFDLLEFPCQYSFKAMCRVEAVSSSPRDVVHELVARQVGEAKILDMRTTISRTGKFESVTVTVNVSDRSVLEAVYQAFSESTDIVMTL